MNPIDKISTFTMTIYSPQLGLSARFSSFEIPFVAWLGDEIMELLTTEDPGLDKKYVGVLSSVELNSASKYEYEISTV